MSPPKAGPPRAENVKAGFSFVEMIVAIFIFALVVTASSGVFVKMIKSYKSAREIQRDLEDAQYAMNLMAKTIRTSSVVSCSNDGGSNFNLICLSVPGINAARVYDYSQDRCVTYRFSSNKLKVRSDSPSTPGDKSTCVWNSANDDLITNFVSAVNFSIVQSAPDVAVGKATISMQVCPASGCPAGSDKAIIQTSVSLRDYTETGL